MALAQVCQREIDTPWRIFGQVTLITPGVSVHTKVWYM